MRHPPRSNLEHRLFHAPAANTIFDLPSATSITLQSSHEHERLHDFFTARFRPRRPRAFCATFAVTNDMRIVDVAGRVSTWSMVPIRPPGTIINLEPPPENLPAYIRCLNSGARALPFSDRRFDIAFSNSVIEILGTFNDQAAFTREIQRVAHRYYVQTPDLLFPIELH